MTKLEESIKAKLNIKYSAAKQLIAEAKQNLEITDEGADREEEILDEATQIFEDDLLPDEQEAMRISGEVSSNWKARAVAAAERRKAEQEAAQPPPDEGVQEKVAEEQEEQPPVDEIEEQGDALVQEENVEEMVEQEGDGGDLGNEVITELKTTTVAEDGTQTITTRTVKKTVTEEGQTKVVVCCVIL